MGERVNLSELARRLEQNKGYVHRLKSKGILVFDVDGKIDEAEARAAILAAKDPAKAYMQEVNDAQREAHRGAQDTSKAAPPATSANSGYHTSKAAREFIEARRAQVELDRMLGGLLNATEVHDETVSVFRRVRDAMTVIPDRLAPIVAAESDPRRVHAYLADEIRKVLDELSSRYAAEAELGDDVPSPEGQAAPI